MKKTIGILATGFALSSGLAACGARSGFDEIDSVAGPGLDTHIPENDGGAGGTQVVDAGSDVKDGGDSGIVDVCKILVKTAASPEVFDANWQGVDVMIENNQTAEISVMISQNGVLIKNLFKQVLFKNGDHNVTWDGKDDLGNVVPEGIYQYEVNALDGNCADDKKGAFEMKNGAEFNCPADKICVNKMKSPEKLSIGTVGGTFLKTAIINNLNQTIELKDLPVYFNAGGSTPIGGNNGLLDAQGKANYSYFELTPGGDIVLGGPAELQLTGDGVDNTQVLKLNGDWFMPPMSKVIVLIRANIANNLGIVGDEVFCSVPDFGKFVTTSGVSLSNQLITTPNYFGEVGKTLPSAHVVYGDGTVIQ